MTNATRNITLDYFKIFLSVLVITIHMQYLFEKDSPLGFFISNGIARIAVPCFFIINGYHLLKKIPDLVQILKYLRRLVIIYISWTLIYFLFFANEPVIIKLQFLLMGFFHLWYLPALITGTILLFLLKKTIKNNYILLAIAIILYLAGLYIENNYKGCNIYLFRNGLFVGFPFIFLGYFIKYNEKKIVNLSRFVLLSIVCILFLELVREIYIHFHSGSVPFYSLILFCPFLFILILKYSRFKISNGYIGIIASGIYYVHVLAISIAHSFHYMETRNIYVLPLVLFLSMILSVGIIKLNKYFKIFL